MSALHMNFFKNNILNDFNSWDFNFMNKQTQFQNMDKYFIKWNKLLFFKIMWVQVFIAVISTEFYMKLHPFQNTFAPIYH
jgi:hypothetical protein